MHDYRKHQFTTYIHALEQHGAAQSEGKFGKTPTFMRLYLYLSMNNITQMQAIC